MTCQARYHGTAAAYSRGCRCPDAREARRLYVKRRREGRPEPRRVPTIGAARRVRALMAIGHTLDGISAASGVPRQTLRDVARQGHESVYGSTARRIRSAYDSLSMVPGVNRRNINHGRVLGWPPPLAWDDDSIDDPNAKPRMDGPAQHRADVVREEYRHLKGLLPDHEIAQRLGITPQTLRDYVRYRKRAA